MERGSRPKARSRIDLRTLSGRLRGGLVFAMKTVFFSLLAALLVPSILAAQAPADFPELESLRGPYQRNVAAIQAARDTRVAGMARMYVGSIERLQREATARGDLEGALLMKAEIERVGGGQEPTVEERKTMSQALAALRVRYEKDREPVLTAAQRQEQEQMRAYFARLDALQKRLTTQNQLEKALAVKAERERVASEFGEASAVVATGPIIAPGTPTTGSTARLETALADKIAQVVAAKSYVQTELSEPGESGGKDVPENGALLVGFEFTENHSGGMADVRSLRPYFLTREGIVPGKDRGELPKVTSKVMARNGYAVGGVLTWHNQWRIVGIQVVFMKIDARTGRLDPSAANSYKSKWFGSNPRSKPLLLGGDGRPVIGVFGRTGADADSIGLVQMP